MCCVNGIILGATRCVSRGGPGIAFVCVFIERLPGCCPSDCQSRQRKDRKCWVCVLHPRPPLFDDRLLRTAGCCAQIPAARGSALTRAPQPACPDAPSLPRSVTPLPPWCC